MDLQKLNKERIHIGDVMSENEGAAVTVAGWLYDSRALGKVRFIILRDASGEIQVTGIKGECSDEVFELMGKTSRESVVVITGKIRKNEKAPGGREVNPETFEILANAEIPLPIDVSDFSKTELPKRLDFRFLDLHRRKIQAIFKIQSTILQAYREFMIGENAIE